MSVRKNVLSSETWRTCVHADLAALQGAASGENEKDNGARAAKEVDRLKAEMRLKGEALTGHLDEMFGELSKFKRQYGGQLVPHVLPHRISPVPRRVDMGPAPFDWSRHGRVLGVAAGTKAMQEFGRNAPKKVHRGGPVWLPQSIAQDAVQGVA